MRLPLVVLAGAFALAGACTANLDSICAAGPCGPDANAPPPPPATTGSGGAGGGGCPTAPQVGDYPGPCTNAASVGAIIQRICMDCHATALLPTTGAPFTLERFEDTQVAFDWFGDGKPLQVWQLMALALKPKSTTPGISHMPLDDATNEDHQLSPAELSTLEDWLTLCAPPDPEGKGCDQGE